MADNKLKRRQDNSPSSGYPWRRANIPHGLRGWVIMREAYRSQSLPTVLASHPANSCSRRPSSDTLKPPAFLPPRLSCWTLDRILRCQSMVSILKSRLASILGVNSSATQVRRSAIIQCFYHRDYTEDGFLVVHPSRHTYHGNPPYWIRI